MTDSRHCPGVVEIHHTSTADEFLESFQPSHTFWWKPEDHSTIKDWVFRGHADSDWGLVPTALRKEPWERLPFLRPHLTHRYFPQWPSYEAWHADIESKVIEQFHRVCAQTGHPIPGDSVGHHLELEKR